MKTMRSGQVAEPHKGERRRRIGVLMPTWVGDACMATPTLRTLRESFPQAHIVGIMSPLIRTLLGDAWGAEAPWIDDAILFKKKRPSRARGASSGLPLRHQLPRVLRRQKLDAVVLLTNAWWAAAVTWAARIPCRVGYNRDARGFLLTDPLPVPRHGRTPAPISAVDYYLELARWLGCEATSKQMQLSTSSEDKRLADDLWQRIDFDARRETVVINSNSANDQARLWPAERVCELAKRLATERDCQVLLHCGPGEIEQANQVADTVQHPRVASMGMAPELPIGLSRGVISQASVVVSSDSGARHMAVSLNRPVVTLFGPTDPRWTRTYNIPEIEISALSDGQHDTSSEGAEPAARQQHNGMQDISVDRVFQAVATQLDGEAEGRNVGQHQAA